MLGKLLKTFSMMLFIFQIVACSLGGSSSSAGGDTPAGVPVGGVINPVQLNFKVEGDFANGSKIVASIYDLVKLSNPSTAGDSLLRKFVIPYDNQNKLYSVETSGLPASQYIVEAFLMHNDGSSLALAEDTALSSTQKIIRNSVPEITTPTGNIVVVNGAEISPVSIRVNDNEAGQVNLQSGLNFEQLSASFSFSQKPPSSTLTDDDILSFFQEAELYSGDYSLTFTPDVVGAYEISIEISDGYNLPLTRTLSVAAEDASNLTKLDFNFDATYVDGANIVFTIIKLSDLSVIDQQTKVYDALTPNYSIYSSITANLTDYQVIAVVNDADGNSLAIHEAGLNLTGVRTIGNNSPEVTTPLGDVSATEAVEIDPITIKVDDLEAEMANLSGLVNFQAISTTFTFSDKPVDSNLTDTDIVTNFQPGTGYFGDYVLKFIPDVAGTYEVTVTSFDGINTTNNTINIVAAGNANKLDITVERSFSSGEKLVASIIDNRDETVKYQTEIIYNQNQTDYFLSIPDSIDKSNTRALVVLNNTSGISLASGFINLDSSSLVTVENEKPKIYSHVTGDIVATINTETPPFGINSFDNEAGSVYPDVAMNYPPISNSYRFVDLPAGSSLDNSSITSDISYSDSYSFGADLYFTPDVGGTYKIEVKIADGLDETIKVFTIKVPVSGEGGVNVSIN